jgi:hypothetical protein
MEDYLAKITKYDKLKKQLCEKMGIKVLYYSEPKYSNKIDGVKIYTKIEELINDIRLQ